MSSPDVKNKILARRAKFIAAAVTSAGLLGCGSKAEVCLSMVADTGGDGDTSPQPCLEPAIDTGVGDVAPEVCLSPAIDSGAGDTSVTETGPEPCLAPPPADGG